METTITMTNKESQRYDIIKNLIDQKINGTQAAKQLNLSVRQTKRLKKKVKKEGIKGIIHKNRGKESNRKLPDKTRKKIVKIINKEYADFTSQLTYEKLSEIHSIKLSYPTVRRIRIKEGLSIHKPRKTNKKHFTQRERKEHSGELVQYDGSYHNWLENRCTDKTMKKEQCLLLAVDDATGEITPVLAKNEGIEATFKFWKSYLKTKGKPIAIYLDKFSTYKVNHKNATDNQEFMTQFERAMQELDIKVIHANSPQAKGRVERMNETLQDRMIKEMRLAKINNTEIANRFIKKEFIPDFSKRFNVPAKRKGDLHRKLTLQEKQRLHHIFSIKNIRIVRNDFTIQYQNRHFQLAEIQPTTVYKKDEVIIEKHLDRSIHIYKKTSNGEKYLKFIELKEKPEKEIPLKLPALTITKTQYIPPANHPWRSFQFSKNKEIKKQIKV